MGKKGEEIRQNAIRDDEGKIMNIKLSVRVPLDVAKHLKDNDLVIEDVLVDAIGDYSRHGEYQHIHRIEYQWRYNLVDIECTQQVMTLLRVWIGRRSFGGRDPELDDIGRWVGVFLAHFFGISIPSLSGKVASKVLHDIAIKMRQEEGQMALRDRRVAEKMSRNLKSKDEFVDV